MIALSCTGISKTYGIDSIFEDISFTVNAKDKIGLIGVNGAGKTTLMKILMGLEIQDAGEIYYAKDLTIGYLEQNTNLDIQDSAYAYCESIFSDVFTVEEQMRTLEARMQHEHSDDILEAYSALQEKFDQLDGYAVSSKVRGVLNGLGFEESEYLRPISQLSGGQKSRVGVARLLLKKPDILLLDEPTNHLDIAAIKWLENYLKDYNGTIVMISHDRYFLDQITTRIFEIESGELTAYNGNYSTFIVQKKAFYEAELKQYEAQQRELAKQQELIRKFKERGTEKLAKRARSREKRLAHMELVEQPQVFKAHFKMALKAGAKTGKDILIARDLSKAYDQNKVFEHVDFEIYNGDRIGLIGPNGVGKTTLFKILLSQLPVDSGTLSWGHHIVPGYYDQELNTLNLDHTVLEEIHEQKPNLTLTEVRKLLGAFLFSGDDIEKMIHQLSGGERSRVSLLKLMLSSANVLFLDEPTNHLDLYAKETLEEALSNYDGTMLTISHDRYFLNKICNKIFEMTPNGIEVYWGNYDYYQLKTIEKETQNTVEPIDLGLTKTKQKEILKKEKEKKSEEKKLKQSAIDLELKITKMEEALHQLELDLCDPDVYTDPTRTQATQIKHAETKEEIQSLYSELDELLELL